jgi:hypothetical protein
LCFSAGNQINRCKKLSRLTVGMFVLSNAKVFLKTNGKDSGFPVAKIIGPNFKTLLFTRTNLVSKWGEGGRRFSVKWAWGKGA